MVADVSDERRWDYIEAIYLTAKVDKVQRRIHERMGVGRSTSSLTQ